MPVCIADRTGLDEAAATLGGDVLMVETDVSDRASVEALADWVTPDLVAAAVLMNSTGMGGGGDAMTNPKGWDRLLAVNLMGPIHDIQAFVPAMVEAGQPGLVGGARAHAAGEWRPDQRALADSRLHLHQHDP